MNQAHQEEGQDKGESRGRTKGLGKRGLPCDRGEDWVTGRLWVVD